MSYAKQFIDMLNEYYSHREIWDDELKIQIMEQEIEITKKPKIKYPPRGARYFSPSQANSCARELYMKLKGSPKDIEIRNPIQSRWQSMGTRTGQEVQETLLKAEKHWSKISDTTLPFEVARTEEGYPFWEDFVKRFVTIEYRGKKINLFGKGDGLLKTPDGKYVGLEVKSKSTTPAQTSWFSMKEPKEDHAMQTICYQLLYPEIEFDAYLILYWNLSKKGWTADASKDPDIRCFELNNTEEMKIALLDRFHYVLECVDNNTPPPLDLTKFNFNNYKVACALDLSAEEVEELKEQVRKVKASSQPQYVKNSYFEAMKKIVDIRAEYGK